MTTVPPLSRMFVARPARAASLRQVWGQRLGRIFAPCRNALARLVGRRNRSDTAPITPAPAHTQAGANERTVHHGATPT